MPNILLEPKDYQELLRELHQTEAALDQSLADSKEALKRVRRALELVNLAGLVVSRKRNS